MVNSKRKRAGSDDPRNLILVSLTYEMFWLNKEYVRIISEGEKKNKLLSITELP